MNFTCYRSECGAQHPATVIEHREDITEEKRSELRTAWYKAIEKLHAKYDGAVASKESVEAAEALERKTCAAYLNAVKWQQHIVPETMVTDRVGKEYKLRCQYGKCKDEL